MHPIWSGSISFGLISIPVKLYTGSESHSLDLDMLRKSDLCPIKYLRICELDGKEVPYNEIVKGYEYSDGEYVVLTDEDFENADIEQTHAIDIMDFINEGEIDSRFFERPYYLEPDRGGDKPYALLREALKKSGKVGVANFVLRNRGHLGIVKPQGDAIVLNQIRYVDEVRNFGKMKLPDAKNVREKEIDLALTLINQLSEKFKPEKYKDTYNEDLKRIVEDKAKGRKPKPKGKEPQPAKVIDIMSLLKKSLKEGEKGKGKRKTAA
jgi:DNA end-binding protein Ku